MGLRRLNLTALTGLALACAAPATAAAAAKGNATAIAWANREVSAVSRYHSVELTETGGLAAFTGDSLRLSSWLWFTRSTPLGWAPAAETSTVELSNDRVVWESVGLTPSGCTGLLCPTQGVVVVTNRSGEYAAVGDTRRHGCFTQVGAAAGTIGTRFEVAGGTYLAPSWGTGTAMIAARMDVMVTNGVGSYGYYPALITDTVALDTGLPSVERVSVAGTKRLRPVSSYTRMRFSQRTLRAPKLTVCS